MNTHENLQALLLTTDQLLCRGLSGQAIRRAVSAGDLIRIRPGFYVDNHARALGRSDRHMLSILAANAALDAPVFSHSSAAIIHGLPDWGLSLGRLSLAEEGTTTRTRSTRQAKFHSVRNLSEHVTSVNGILVTTPERTITDIALSSRRDASVTVADAALKRTLITKDELANSLEKSAGRHGIRRARYSMSLVDEKSESVAETLSRLTFLDFDIPKPETQVEVFNDRGVLVARADFLWREFGVIGECDGFGKYFNGRSPIETRQELAKEKDRDAELMALGHRVVHWRWHDIEEPIRLATRIRRVLFATGSSHA